MVLLRPNSILQDVFGNDFAIRKIEFFIYDVELLLSDGQVLEVRDSILLNLDGSDKYYKNDFKRIFLNRSTYNIGTASSDGTIQEVSFNIGLDTPFDQLDFTDLSSSFVLKTFEDSLYVDDHFVSVELELERDTMVMDTMLMESLECQGRFTSQRICQG